MEANTLTQNTSTEEINATAEKIVAGVREIARRCSSLAAPVGDIPNPDRLLLPWIMMTLTDCAGEIDRTLEATESQAETDHERAVRNDARPLGEHGYKAPTD